MSTAPRPPSPAPSPARAALEAELASWLPTLQALDAKQPDAAARLEAEIPFAGPSVARVRDLCKKGMEEGWLLPKEGGPKVKFGRLAKDLGGFAVDVVWMEGKGLGHTHTKGEINLCLDWAGLPRFHEHLPGWVVFAPGSHHVPTVTGGEMLFVYFTPGGAVVWDPPPAKPTA
jgi:hypothetical protein